MLATTENLLEKGFADHVIKDWNLTTVFGGTDARRYALMNKALEKGEVIRLCRGKYILSPKYRSHNISKFFVASQMVPNGYISAESALSFHGWIPERVNVVVSVISKGRTRSFDTVFGHFEYIKICVKEYEFLSGVVRKEVEGKPFLIATPLRALADYVYIKKLKWTGLDFLLEGMRIEMEELNLLTSKDFEELAHVYTSKSVLSFLKQLKKTLEK